MLLLLLIIIIYYVLLIYYYCYYYYCYYCYYYYYYYTTKVSRDGLVRVIRLRDGRPWSRGSTPDRGTGFFFCLFLSVQLG